jgi:hypothetical protein
MAARTRSAFAGTRSYLADSTLMLLARVRNLPDEGLTGTYLFEVNADDRSML